MTDAAPPLVEVDEVRRRFPVRTRPWAPVRHVHAVDGVTVAVRHGETLAVVGESGSGKTTLARMVLRLEVPDAGRILFDGEDIRLLRGTRLRQHQRRVQAVFQNPWSSLNPRIRVGASIAEPLQLSTDLSRAEIRARVERLLVDVGLSPAAALRLPNQFSGGQRQRIALARALAPDPALLVLDEPVSALDVSVRAQIMNLLHDVQEERGLAYLMIAHDLATVRYLAHQVAVMYLGRLVECAPSEDLFTRSRHPYTRALVSAAVVDLDQGTPAIVLNDDIPSPVDPPSGCPFHTRCWLYEQLGRPERCRTEVPPLQDVGDGHVAACHFDDAVAEETVGVVPTEDAHAVEVAPTASDA